MPANLNGVPMQEVVNDPITLLRKVIEKQVADGHTFKGAALNIATHAKVTFSTEPNRTTNDPTTDISVTGAGGGIENIPFLEGGEPVGAQGPNADTALVYATFWIEKVTHPQKREPFMQLQYAQMVVLNFPILTAPAPPVVLGWPHISVVTLTKSFS
ncbi:MAG: hypothetical protein ACREQX_08655 [Candidatus Binataceae bacterium]